GSANRPSPDNPLASSPFPGGMMTCLYDCSRAIFLTVAGCFHISKSIAGALKTGHLAERKKAVGKLSKNPGANFERVFADAGAISMRDRKSKRLNSSHVKSSYPVSRLKKKKLTS